MTDNATRHPRDSAKVSFRWRLALGVCCGVVLGGVACDQSAPRNVSLRVTADTVDGVEHRVVIVTQDSLDVQYVELFASLTGQ